jgi:hypothetical protein
MDKQNVLYTNNEILCSLKNEGHLTPATTWLNLGGIALIKQDKH